MPLMAHLRELRSRIFKSLLAVAVGAVVGWIYYKPIFDFLTAPVRAVVDDAQANGLDIRLVLTSVASPFVLQLKVSVDGRHRPRLPGVDLPDVGLHHPGLHKHERRYALGFVAAALPLFLGGVLVAMWVLPKGMELLFGFTPEDVGNYLSVDTYLSFLIRTVLVFGLGFLVPIFIVALNLVGILRRRCDPTHLAVDGARRLPVRCDRHTDGRPAQHDAARRPHAAAHPRCVRRSACSTTDAAARRHGSWGTPTSPTTRPPHRGDRRAIDPRTDADLRD